MSQTIRTSDVINLSFGARLSWQGTVIGTKYRVTQKDVYP